MKEGTYYKKFKKNPVVIGQKLAQKLNAKVKSKIVLSFQDTNNEIASVAFRVEGIYKSSSSRYDEYNIFVRQADLKRVGLLGDNIHEVAIRCHSIDDVDEITTTLEQAISDNTVGSWSQVAPELGYAQEIMSNAIYIFMGIILFALAFGIVRISKAHNKSIARFLGLSLGI